MAGVVTIDSHRVIEPAVLFKEICEKSNIPLPDLRHILGVLVSAKICPDHWLDIASRAYPKEARTFAFQVANIPAMQNLKDRPMDALHILGTAHLSTDANSSGLFKNFCAHIGHQPNTASQLLFFASHLIESHPDAIWHSEFIANTLNTNADTVRGLWVPRINEFLNNTTQQILHENYALLLSGIHFDYNRLEQKSLNAAHFPCLQPPQLLADKPHMYIELFDRVSVIKSMKPTVDVRKADPDAIATADELIEKVVPGAFRNFRKTEIAAWIKTCDELIQHLDAAKFSEPELRQQACSELNSLKTKIVVARTKADYQRLERAGKIQHMLSTIPPVTMKMKLSDIHDLIAGAKLTLVTLDQYKN